LINISIYLYPYHSEFNLPALAITVNLNFVLYYTDSSTKISTPSEMALTMMPDADQKNMER
jgi:hypothetical protein